METVYLVPEHELRLLSAFDLLASLLLVALGILAPSAAAVSLNGAPWSAAKIATVAALGAATLGLGAWLVWGMLIAKGMLLSIKQRSDRKTSGNGNGATKT